MKKRSYAFISFVLTIILLQSMILPVFAVDAKPVYFDGVETLKNFVRQEGTTKDGVTVYLIATDNENVTFIATISADDHVVLGITALPPALNGNGFTYSCVTVLGISATDSEWEVMQVETLSAGKTSVSDSITAHINPLELTSDYEFEVESFESASKSTTPGEGLIGRGTDGLHSIITLLDRDLKNKNADFTLSDIGFEKYAIDAERESEIVKAPAKSAPLSLSKLDLTNNSIGVPVLSAVFANTGNGTIEGFDFVVECYDVYGELVKGYNRYSSISCSYDQNITPGGTSRWDWEWTLHGFDGAKTVRVAVNKYKVYGEPAVEIPESQLIWLEK